MSCGTQPPRWPGMISTYQYSNSVPSHSVPNLVYVTNSITQMWHLDYSFPLVTVTGSLSLRSFTLGKTSCCVVSTLQLSNGQVHVVSN